VTERFPTPSPIGLVLRVPAGRVEIDAADTDETVVTLEPLNGPARDRLDKVVIARSDDELRVEVPEHRGFVGRTPEYDVAVRCPAGSRVRLRGASADLEARGRLAELDVRSASGDVAVEDVDGVVRADSASGDVRVGSAGEVQLRTASGDLSVGRVDGPAKAQSVSGDVEIGEAAGAVEVQTVSGDLRVARVAAGPVSVSAVSGDVELAVAPGAAVWLDLRSLSGTMRSELEAGEPSADEHVVELRGKTVSGDVRVRRTAA
jgi:hypothetical protein